MELYLNASYPISDRVEDLLKRMTVKEKVGQLNQKLFGFNTYKKQKDQFIILDEFKDEVKKYSGIGVLYGLFRADPWACKTYESGITGYDAAKVYNQFQKYVLDNSRLKIPMMLSSESPHGHQALDGYLLPVNLACGCTFNPSLLKDAYNVCSTQQKLMGVTMSLMSTLDVLRDPRWGRSEECYSEDPFLSKEMAVAAMEGCQYDSKGNIKMISVVKHFAAQGQCSGGLNTSAAAIGNRELREIHLPVMKELCGRGVLSCMAAYNEIDGVPCHGNKGLLTDILRGEFGFTGAVMADGGANDHLEKLTGSMEKAGAMALNAGVDISLWDTSFTTLEKALEEGYITKEVLDNAVRRVLELKFKVGLFENPYVSERAVTDYIADNYKKYPQSLELARQSVVLLENKDSFLPINANTYRKIAVIGPNANNVYNQMGDYTPPVRDGSGITIFEGIKEFNFGATTYSIGCSVCNDSVNKIDEAVNLASESDLVILALGGSSTRNFNVKFDINGAVIADDTPLDMDCGEGVDVSNLNLGGRQMELFDKIAKLNKPIITVINQGRPYALGDIPNKTNALLASFYAGPMAGKAIAEIIFGKTQPSGRLSVSIPKSSDTLPCFYNYKRSAVNLRYSDSTRDAMYEFGYGLGYGNIEYKSISVESDEIKLMDLVNGDKFKINVSVKNKSEHIDYSTPLLFIKDLECSVIPRTKELKGFAKERVLAHESKTFSLYLGKDELTVYDINNQYTVEKGNVLVEIFDGEKVIFSHVIKII